MSELRARMTDRPRVTLSEASGVWWLYLITGGLWLLVSILVFRFDWDSVSAISILFGVVMLGAALNEFLSMSGASRGWKLAHAALGVVCLVVGIVSFVHPGGTFAALSAVISFYFIAKGMFDLILGIVITELRWLRIVTGLVELVLGLWAAAYFGHSAILLVVWVAVIALTRGIGEIVFAFTLREMRKTEPLTRAG